MKKYLPCRAIGIVLLCIAFTTPIFSQTFSLGVSVSFPVPAAASRMVAGDFDVDGDIDFLYQTGANGTAFQYARNDGNAVFATLALSASPFAGLAIPNNTSNNHYAADFDSDGDVDLLVAVNGTTGSYFRNDGLSGFVSLSTTGFPAPGAGSRMITGDFDIDGDIDILYQTGGDGSVFQFARNNGNATFVLQALSASPFAGLTIPNNIGGSHYAYDFDFDGDVDLLAGVNSTTGSFFVNNGISGFASLSTASFPAPGAAARMIPGDFDSDGDIDILYQTGGAGTIFQYARNNGNNTFTVVALGLSPFAALSLIDVLNTDYVFDFDGDGDVDIFLGINAAVGLYLVQNDRPPYITASVPADNAPAVLRDANIVVTLNEPVVKGSGNIYIVRTSDNVVVETIAVGSAQVTGAGNIWTINPSITLDAFTSYAIRADRRIFADITGAIFIGIGNNIALNFTTNAVLPVRFVSFDAKQTGETTTLNWSTGSEENSSHFLVEHSLDAQQWNVVGRVNAAGNSTSLLNYQYIHADPATGINYYRIRQVDFDGRFEVTSTRQVNFMGSGSAMVLLENPVSKSMLTMKISTPGSLVIYNSAGILMHRKQYAAGVVQVSVAGWSAGAYHARMGEKVISFVIQ